MEHFKSAVAELSLDHVMALAMVVMAGHTVHAAIEAGTKHGPAAIAWCRARHAVAWHWTKAKRHVVIGAAIVAATVAGMLAPEMATAANVAACAANLLWLCE